jgi:hypothetical protein
MPGYITQAPERFNHPVLAQPMLSPYPWERPNYGVKSQLMLAINTSKSISSREKRCLQEVLGTLLYHARAIDSTTSYQ